MVFIKQLDVGRQAVRSLGLVSPGGLKVGDQNDSLVGRGGLFEQPFSAAQRLRVDRGRPSGVFSWPPDADKFATCYDLAQANFHEIIRDYPRSPEAAESQFMLGLVCDYPHLVTFDQALDEYRKTIESYPDTDAARKAAARKKIIEDIMGNKSVTPIIRR